MESQTRLADEVIVVDNASTDGSVDLIQTHHKTVKIIQLPSNVGFAAANNIAAKSASGDWLVLLNPDAFPEPDWLAAFENAIQKHPNTTTFTGLLTSDHDQGRIDGTGDIYHISGLAWRRAHGMAISQAGKYHEPVFSACGASAVYRKDVFVENGGFDDDFFCYMEDVDLGFRLQLQGHQCLYIPEAVAHHIGSAITGVQSDFSIYHGHRNLVWVFAKNMPISLLLLFLPIHLFLNLISLIWFAAKGQERAIWSAKADALKKLPDMLEKRKTIQQNKKIKAKEVFTLLNKRLLPARR